MTEQPEYEAEVAGIIPSCYNYLGETPLRLSQVPGSGILQSLLAANQALVDSCTRRCMENSFFDLSVLISRNANNGANVLVNSTPSSSY
jgi:hypothetical protein